MRVKSVSIPNFKRFETLEVDLSAMDCLVGANNSGKTTLLQALALFDFCIHHCLERKNGQLLDPCDLPDEVHELAQRLARFAGVLQISETYPVTKQAGSMPSCHFYCPVSSP